MTVDIRPDMTGRDTSERDFERLYRRMLPTVHRFTSARLGRIEGEDVTAEVFHAAAVGWADGRREQVTDAWLMAVARNKVIDRWRKAERRNALAHLAFRRERDAVTFPEDWSRPSQREQVLAALDRIGPRHRHLLVAHYVDGYPAPELAELLDSSVAAVESALARARRAFRAAFDTETTP